MNRELLKELGLTDEQIEEVMKAHGKSVNELKGQVNELESLKTQNEDLTKQLTERDEQLEELKKIDAERLQAKIEELQQANEQTKNEYEEKLQQQAFEHKLHDTMKESGVRNVKAVKALLDVESIKLDGDKLLGLDDQLEQLKETDDYLFRNDSQTDNSRNIFNPGNPKGGGSG